MRRALSLTYNASLFVYYKSLIYRPMVQPKIKVEKLKIGFELKATFFNKSKTKKEIFHKKGKMTFERSHK